MPVKKATDYTAESQPFLDDHHFRAAIYLASRSFYAILEKQDFVLGKLSDREVSTLRKYINRYCFRPTPFGLFASVTLMEWGASPDHTDNGPPTFEPHFYTDQNYQAIISQELLRVELKDGARFEGNPSLYRVFNEYRFFRVALDEHFKQREYLLQSIAFSKLLKDLITW